MDAARPDLYTGVISVTIRRLGREFWPEICCAIAPRIAHRARSCPLSLAVGSATTTQCAWCLPDRWSRRANVVAAAAVVGTSSTARQAIPAAGSRTQVFGLFARLALMLCCKVPCVLALPLPSTFQCWQCPVSGLEDPTLGWQPCIHCGGSPPLPASTVRGLHWTPKPPQQGLISGLVIRWNSLSGTHYWAVDFCHRMHTTWYDPSRFAWKRC